MFKGFIRFNPGYGYYHNSTSFIYNLSLPDLPWVQFCFAQKQVVPDFRGYVFSLKQSTRQSLFPPPKQSFWALFPLFVHNALHKLHQYFPSYLQYYLYFRLCRSLGESSVSQAAGSLWGKTSATAAECHTSQLNKYQPLPSEPVQPDLSSCRLTAAVDFNCLQLLNVSLCARPERADNGRRRWRKREVLVKKAGGEGKRRWIWSVFDDRLNTVRQHPLCLRLWLEVVLLVPCLFSLSLLSCV